MSAISLKSITGITSITTPAGADNQLTLHTNNTTEAVKLDTAGNLHFHNHLNITGVSSASNFKTGSTNVHSTGVELANINTGGGTATFGGNVHLGDGDIIKLGAGNDLTMRHNGSASVIENFTGNFILGAATSGNLEIRQVINDEVLAKFISNGAVELYYNNSKKLETTNVGVTVTGELRPVGDLVMNTSDNLKIRLGASNDLNLEHNGSDSYITSNTGNFVIQHSNNSGDLEIKAHDFYVKSYANEKYIRAQADGAVELYHDDTLKLSTNNNGINVSGSISLTDNGRLYLGSSNDAYLYHDSSNTHFVNGTGNLLFRQAANADVVIQTNAIDRFRIHEDGVVAIGQSSKSGTVGAGNLDIQGNATNCIIEMGNPFPGFSGGVVPEFRITATNSGHTVDFERVWGGDNLLHKHLAFSGGSTIFYKGTNNDEIARFNSNKFGLGTASPGQLIHIHSGSSSGSLQIQSNGSNNYIAAIQTANNFANGSTAGGLVIRSGNGIEFSGNDGATVQMRLASGNLTIGDGNLVIGTGGHGIDFSARGNTGGMTSELLDHYEEGSWTPSIYPMSSNIPVTYNIRAGQYTRIGNVVYWQFKIQVSNITGNRNQGFGISGFPYNINNTHTQCSSEFYGETWDGEIPTTIKYISNVNRGVCYYYADAMKYYSSSMLDINVSSSMLMGAGHYFV